MSAEPMPDPVGEVLLDGRIMRMDGSYSGTYAAGEVVRGSLGSSEPPIIMVPAGTLRGPIDLDNTVGAIIPYRGEAPRYIIHEPVADVFWFETFMERLMRDLDKRESVAS